MAQKSLGTWTQSFRDGRDRPDRWSTWLLQLHIIWRVYSSICFGIKFKGEGISWRDPIRQLQGYYIHGLVFSPPFLSLQQHSLTLSHLLQSPFPIITNKYHNQNESPLSLLNEEEEDHGRRCQCDTRGEGRDAVPEARGLRPQHQRNHSGNRTYFSQSSLLTFYVFRLAWIGVVTWLGFDLVQNASVRTLMHELKCSKFLYIGGSSCCCRWRTDQITCIHVLTKTYHRYTKKK